MLPRTSERQFVTRKSPSVAGNFLKLPPDASLPPEPLEAAEAARLSIVHDLVPDLVPPNEFRQKSSGREKLIDTSKLNRSEIDALVEAGYMPAGKEIPEILPVFTGLRARVLEMRAGRMQRKVERLAKKQKQINYIGEKVLLGESYTTTDPEKFPKRVERPHTMGVKLSGNRLGRLNTRFVNVAKRRHTLERTYPRAMGKTPSYIPFTGIREYDMGPGDHIKLSLGERRSLNRAAKRHIHAGIAHSIYGHLFRRSVTKPGRKAEGSAEKRDEFAIKAEVLRRARDERREVVRQSLDTAAEKVLAGSRRTREGARKGTKATRKAAKHVGEFTAHRLKGGGWAELADKAAAYRAEAQKHSRKKRQKRKK
jgi:hypothetical protein